MTRTPPPAYCYFQDLAPRPPLDAVFDRDYLLYAMRGALRVTLAGHAWLLPPSFAAWVPAGTPFVAEISKPVTACSVLAEPGFARAMPPEPVAFQMSPMTREMIRYCRDWGDKDDHPPEAVGFFRALLDACARLAETSVDIRRPTATDPSLKRALDITEARLAERITSAEVARAASHSERSLQRHFSRDVGMTWSEALTRLRMIRAVELLAEDELSILEIASDCGFASTSAFHRAFRGFANATPSVFRASLRG